MRSLTWIGLLVGATIGSILPSIFGISEFSVWSILFSLLGGAIGIWVGYQYESNL